MSSRIPPIQCLLTFEALARLRSVTLTAEELFVTPSAVSHRVKQLEQLLGVKLFGRADFSLTSEGNEYLSHVRQGLASLERFPGQDGGLNTGKRKLRLAVKGSHLGLALYLCELAGLEILALRRIRLGRVSLGDLEEGTWRYLGEGERF